MESLAARAAASTPGGVHSNVRLSGPRVFIERAHDAWIFVEAGANDVVTTSDPWETTEMLAARRLAFPAQVMSRFWFGEGGASAADFGDYLLGGFVPDEGFGVVVPVFDPDVDGLDE